MHSPAEDDRLSGTLSERQREVLRTVCDALVPHEPTTADRVEALIASISDAENQGRLALLLSTLDSRVANLLLSGRFQSFVAMDHATRESVLRGYAHSRIPLRRAGFQALKRLVHVGHYCWPNREGSHSAWEAVGYPGPLPQPNRLEQPVPTLRVETESTLECDVVVVGSGAGGGVVAGVLAEAGRDVLVLEKGGNPGSRDMTHVEGEMLQSMYLDGGLMMTQSGSMPVLAGSCVGGGTTVNYTTSFRLPENVRREWDMASGLSLFSSDRFTASLDRVWERLDVSTRWTTPGERDLILERGCRALGWHVDVMPRNVTECLEGLECGYCGYGCRHGAKNSTTKTYLADAVSHGAQIVPHCDVDRVLTHGGRATGVLARVRLDDGSTRELTVRARAVVSAAGAIYTPVILMRSGVTNRNVGRGLRLHPATAVVGIFPQRVEPWSGSLQTRYSDQFADLDAGYGAKFETAPVHFALPASAFGWDSVEQVGEDIAKLGHTGLVGILLRDRDPGRVSLSRRGSARIHYELSRYDVGHLRTAIRAAAQVLAAAGATEVITLQNPPVRARPDGREWLDKFMAAADGRGYRYCRMSYITFHQMASAAMGREPTSSVVGETGESHDVPGLYVADGSTFPTSSGVNPMITIMAIADCVAREVDKAL